MLFVFFIRTSSQLVAGESVRDMLQMKSLWKHAYAFARTSEENRISCYSGTHKKTRTVLLSGFAGAVLFVHAPELADSSVLW